MFAIVVGVIMSLYPEESAPLMKVSCFARGVHFIIPGFYVLKMYNYYITCCNTNLIVNF